MSVILKAIIAVTLILKKKWPITVYLRYLPNISHIQVTKFTLPCYFGYHCYITTKIKLKNISLHLTPPYLKMTH